MQQLNYKNFKLTDAHTAGNEYDVFIADNDTSRILIKSPFIANNSSSVQEITINLKKFTGTDYEVIATDKLFLNESESGYPLLLMDLCLYSDIANPDKVSLIFNNTLNANESIDIVFTYVKFLEV